MKLSVKSIHLNRINIIFFSLLYVIFTALYSVIILTQEKSLTYASFLISALLAAILYIYVLLYVRYILKNSNSREKNEIIDLCQNDLYSIVNQPVLVISNSDLKIDYVNNEFCNKVQYSRSELLNTGVVGKVVSEDQIELIREQLELYDGKIENTIISIYNTRGIEIRLESSIILNKYKNQLIIAGKLEDRNKYVQEKMKSSLFDFQNIFNNTSVGYIVLSSDKTIKRINSRFTAMLDYTADYTVGRKIDSLPMFDIKSLSQIDAIMKKEVSDIEFPFISANGDIVWTLLSAKKINLENVENGYLLSFQDITSKKRVEGELSESKKTYSSLLENTGNATFVARTDGVIILCNEETVKLVGDQKQNIENIVKWENFILEEDKDIVLEKYSNFLQGRSQNILINNITLKSKYFGNKKVLLKLNKTPGGSNITISIIDITEIQEAKSKLNILQSSIEKAQKIAKIGYWYHDIKTDNIEWSDGMYDIFSVPRTFSPSVESNFNLFGDSYYTYMQQYNKLVDDKEDSTIELKVKKPNGELLWFKDYIHFSIDDKGAIDKIFGLTQDLTAEKQRDSEIVGAKDRLDFIIKSVNLGIWDWNIINNKVFRNDIWYKILNYSATNFPYPDDISDYLVHPDDYDNYIGSYEDHINGITEFFQSEYRMKNAYDEWIWVRDSGIVVEKNDNKPSRMIGVLEKINERKYKEILDEKLIEITSMLINSDNKENSLNRIVDIVGKTSNADRCFLFEYFDNYRYFSLINEWVSQELENDKDHYQNLSTEMFPWWLNKMKAQENIILNRCEDIPDDAANEKEILLSARFKSMVIVPVYYDNILYGFFGVGKITKHVEWMQEHIEFIINVTRNISKFYKRDEKIQ